MKRIRRRDGRRVKRWMDGSIDRLIDGGMGGWIDGGMDDLISGWMVRRTGGSIAGFMNSRNRRIQMKTLSPSLCRTSEKRHMGPHRRCTLFPCLIKQDRTQNKLTGFTVRPFVSVSTLAPVRPVARASVLTILHTNRCKTQIELLSREAQRLLNGHRGSRTAFAEPSSVAVFARARVPNGVVAGAAVLAGSDANCCESVIRCSQRK